MRHIQSLIFSICLTIILTACKSTKMDESRAHPLVQPAALQDSAAGLQHFSISTDFGPIAMSRANSETTRQGPLILMCMGATENRYRSNPYYIQRAINDGDVITFDYPGYGQSSGNPTTAHFEQAADRLVDFIDIEAQRTGRSVVVWGHSMGGFVCSEIARRSRFVDAVIIETSARNIDNIVSKGIPFFARPLAATFVNDALRGYDIVNSLSGYKGQILVLGAEKDLILNVKLSRELSGALSDQGNQVRYVEFPKVGHTDLFKGSGFRGLIRNFLSDFR